jgi:acyl-ACP thioesterase
MLNAADFHSTDRGFGMKRLMTMGRSWVLSRLAIEMTEMPKQYTRFNVETWVENAMRYFTSRNFAVVAEPTPNPSRGEGSVDTSSTANSNQTPLPSGGVGGGLVLGYGRSIWAMIDTTTRQPTDLFSIDDGAINNWIEKEKPCPIDKGGRVRMSDQAELVREIDTYYNDVDINGHINSVKYIEHVLDLWPIDWYRDHAIRRFEIAYVAEAHAGDRLAFYREQTADEEFCVRICKIEGNASERCDDKDNIVEVARSKIQAMKNYTSSNQTCSPDREGA